MGERERGERKREKEKEKINRGALHFAKFINIIARIENTNLN